jgi:hypothetical protein
MHNYPPPALASLPTRLNDCSRSADYASQGAFTLALVEVGPSWTKRLRNREESLEIL